MLLKRSVFVVSMITVVLFLWMGQEQHRFVDSENFEMVGLPHVGHIAPDFILHNLKLPEEKIQLSTLTEESRGTIVYFWTSWCPFCASSMGALQKAYTVYGENISFLGVNVTNQDSLSAAEQFLKEHGIEFDNVSDLNGSVSSSYFVPPIPASLFIDGEGLIVHRKVGAITYQEIQQVMNQLERGVD